MADHGHDHGHGEVRVEESSLPNKSVFGFVAITAVVFFGSAFTLPTVFYRIIDHMTMETSAPPAELGAMRKHEAEQLGSYGYVDKQKQIVHIPIEVAMEKVVEDAKK